MKNKVLGMFLVLVTLMMLGVSSNACYAQYFRIVNGKEVPVDFVTYNKNNCGFKSQFSASHFNRMGCEVLQLYPGSNSQEQLPPKEYAKAYPLDINNKALTKALVKKMVELHQENIKALVAYEAFFLSPSGRQWGPCYQEMKYLFSKAIQLSWAINGVQSNIQYCDVEDITQVRWLLDMTCYIENMVIHAKNKAPVKEDFMKVMQEISDRNYEIATIALLLYANAHKEETYYISFNCLTGDSRLSETTEKVLKEFAPSKTSGKVTIK